MKTAWKVLTLALISPTAMAAKSQGQLKNDLKNHINRTSRGASFNEVRERAEMMDRVGLYHIAMHERLKLVRSNKATSRDLEKIGDTALALDHLEPLPGYFAKRRDLPASLKVAMASLQLRLGSASRAAEWLPNNSSLGNISAGPARVRAALVASGAWAAIGRPNDALEALSVVPDGRGPEYGVIHLQRARIHYGERRNGDALEALIKLPRSSPAWYPGVIVGAWSAYRVQDYNLALGSLMTLHSPFLAAKFNPEAYTLQAATLYRLCYYDSAATTLKNLRERYGRMGAAIERFRGQYGNRFALVSALLNFARDKTADGDEDWERVADALLTQEPFAEADRGLTQVKKEDEIMADIFGKTSDNRFNRGMKSAYAQILETARREYYRKALKSAVKRLGSMRREVGDALESALAIEVEINTRIRERLLVGQTPRRKEIRFEANVKKGYEFWPFEGEYWQDEVGGYAFATSDVCGGAGS